MARVGLMRGLPISGDSRERGHDAVVDEVTPNQPTMPIPQVRASGLCGFGGAGDRTLRLVREDGFVCCVARGFLRAGEERSQNETGVTTEGRGVGRETARTKPLARATARRRTEVRGFAARDSLACTGTTVVDGTACVIDEEGQ
ncbi:MAG: hypothetical protein EBU66_12375 [Bacteroidetes bacterium]|nr:hypothetical protein [Bacteroidota bacterium]